MAENPSGMPADRPEQRKGAEASPVHLSVDPLKHATVTTGEHTVDLRWNTPPSVQVSHSQRAERPQSLPLEGETFADEDKILRVVNTPGVWTQEQALPFTRQDTSRKGTRGIRFVSPDFPGKVVCISGIGVVRAWANDRGQEPTFTIDPPQPETPVSTLLQMGSRYVDSTGTIWRQRNHSPLGAYSKAELQEKLKRTRTFGTDTTAPEIVAAGTYEGTDAGWLAYTLPENALTPVDVLALDLQLPQEQVGSLYGQAIETLFSEIRQLHDSNVVHYQLHPGNWFFSIDAEEKPICILSDWETAGSLDDLPDETTFLQDDASIPQEIEEFADLSPQQKARAIDILNALAATSLVSADNFTRVISKLFPSDPEASEATHSVVRPGLSMSIGMSPVMEQMEYQTAMLARALHAYTDGPADADTLTETAQHLMHAFQEETLRLVNATRDGALIEFDAEELISSGASRYAFPPAFESLMTRTARDLASLT